jgi:hypothetical protein
MIVQLAFLTTPAPDRYVLNIQPHWTNDLFRFEISRAHLAGILIDGCASALRETKNRAAEDAA